MRVTRWKTGTDGGDAWACATFANKMKVRLCKTARGGPFVRMENTVSVGSDAEVDEADRGLAHFLEHMIFKGTPKDPSFDLTILRKQVTKKTKSYIDNGLLPLTETDLLPTHPVSASTLEYMLTAAVCLLEPDLSEDERKEEVMVALAECGALTLSETDIATIARTYGASINAFTTCDKTSYHFEVGKRAAPVFLSILATSARVCRMEQEHVNSEVLAVLSEMAMGDDQPLRSAYMLMRQHLYSTDEAHHYDTIGSERALGKVTAERLRAFYNKHYHTRNMTLYVTGVFEMKDMKALTERLFGTILPVSGSRMEDRVDAAPWPRRTLTTLYHNVHSKHFLFGARLPGTQAKVSDEKAHADGGDEHDADLAYSNYNAMELFANVLGGGTSSRLVEALVNQREPLASSVTCGVDRYRNDSVLCIDVVPLKGVSLERLESALRNALPHKDGGDFLKAWTDAEKEAALITTKRSWEDTRTTLEAWTSSWLDQEGDGCACDDIFTAPSLNSSTLRAFESLSSALDLDIASVVVVAPFGTKANEERAACHVAGRRKPDHVRKSTLEAPVTANTLPGYSPIEAIDLPDYGVPKILPGNRVVFRKVGLLRTVRAIHVLHPPTGFESLSILVWRSAINRTKRAVELRKALDAVGSVYSCGSTDAFLSTTVHSSIELWEELVSAVDFTPTEPMWEHAKNVVCDAIEAKQRDGVANALHKLMGSALDDAWTLDEGLTYVKGLTMSASKGNFVLAWKHTVDVTTSPPQEKHPCDAAGDPAQGDVDTLRLSYLPPPELKTLRACPLTEHTVLLKGSSMSVVAYGRRGVLPISDPSYNTKRAMLEAVCYHSLGSRLYQLREAAGLFYSASGAFGAHASVSQGATQGFDYIIMRVKPRKVADAKVAINAFASLKITDAERAAAAAIVAAKWANSLHGDAFAPTMAYLYATRRTSNAFKLPAETIDGCGKVDTQQLNDFAVKMGVGGEGIIFEDSVVAGSVLRAVDEGAL